jgi:hypothetical protein
MATTTAYGRTRPNPATTTNGHFTPNALDFHPSSKAVASWDDADTLAFRAERKHGRALSALFEP